MKKNNVMVIAVLLMAVLFTGCSKEKQEVKGETKAKSGNESAAEAVVLFGKVNAVTGNELEVLLAKDPYADKAPKNSGNTDQGAAAASMTPATEAGEEMPQAPKMQLEYTGDEKNIIVPAGAKITGQTGGEEQLDAIQKGSVIIIMMEHESVKEIGIME